MRPLDLSINHTYLSPRGLRCRLVPSAEFRAWLVFAYLDLPGGFSLAYGNVHLLRRVL